MDSGWSGYLELELLERGRIKRDGVQSEAGHRQPEDDVRPGHHAHGHGQLVGPPPAASTLDDVGAVLSS